MRSLLHITEQENAEPTGQADIVKDMEFVAKMQDPLQIQEKIRSPSQELRTHALDKLHLHSMDTDQEEKKRLSSNRSIL